MRKLHQGFLFGIAATFVNAILALVIKLCSGKIPNEMMIFTRFFFSWLCLLPLLFQGKIALRLRHLPKHMTRAFAGLISMYCYYFSLSVLPLANAVTYANTMPLFTPFVLLVWMRTLVPLKRFITALVGFLGVLLMMNPTHLVFQTETFIALGTGLGAAIAFVGIRRLSHVETTQTILFFYFSVASSVSFFPFIVNIERLQEGWLYGVLILMALLSLLYQYFMTKSFSLAPASQVGIVMYLTIVFGMLFGWWIWGEVPTIWAISGMSLTIVGGVLSAFEKGPEKKLPKDPQG